MISLCRVYLYDEARRVGAGFRTVTVKIGHKWVKIWTKLNGPQKIPRKVWDDICKDKRNGKSRVEFIPGEPWPSPRQRAPEPQEV